MEAMQAKAISLNDLALLDVDVDQLLNKNEKTRSLSDEMRRSLHIRGRTAYAESLSSIDTDSQHSFSSHATSKSSRSNASSSISSVRSNSSSTSSRALMKMPVEIVITINRLEIHQQNHISV